jgi:hypothetical protein
MMGSDHANGPREAARALIVESVLSWSSEESLQNYERIPRLQHTGH